MIGPWGFLTALVVSIACVTAIEKIGHFATMPCGTVTTLSLPHDFQFSGHMQACVNVVIRDGDR